MPHDIQSTDRLRLIPLSINDGLAVYQMLQTIPSEENAFKNDAFGLTLEEFKEWLVVQNDASMGKGLPEGYVPQSIFWLYKDDVPVGIGKIRHRLTASSREEGGNLGYAIAPDYRRRGYGTVLMELLVDKADALGIIEKLATVEKENYASKRAIEKAGGIQFQETDKRWYFKF